MSLMSRFNTLPSLAIASVCCCKTCPQNQSLVIYHTYSFEDQNRRIITVIANCIGPYNSSK
jgi:hypothetical protein